MKRQGVLPEPQGRDGAAEGQIPAESFRDAEVYPECLRTFGGLVGEDEGAMGLFPALREGLLSLSSSRSGE